AAGRHPGHARHLRPPGGGGRPDRGAPDDVPGADLRPPPDRRPRSRAVPEDDQGAAGGSGAVAAGGLVVKLKEKLIEKPDTCPAFFLRSAPQWPDWCRTGYLVF